MSPPRHWMWWVQWEILQKVTPSRAKFNFLHPLHHLRPLLMVEFWLGPHRHRTRGAGGGGPAKAILTAPLHPYAGNRQLFLPLHGPKTVLGIPGTPSNLLEVPVGCRFQALRQGARALPPGVPLTGSARAAGRLPPL